MKRVFSPLVHDSEGRMIVGNPDGSCGKCGATNVPTVSTEDSLVWWHPPVGCCERSKHVARGLATAGERPYCD